jgi:vacuolar-type H+-ATPase subunit D/Vma8
MGVTGSNCFDKWFVLSDQALHEKINALERKFTLMETNNNTLHTKYATLETKHDALYKKVNNTVSEMESLLPRLDRVEKKASNMLFEQQEPDSDMIILNIQK